MAEHEAYPLLSVEEAQQRVLAHFRCLGAERVPILDALGRVLAEDVAADMDVPPLANSAMDGYAVRAEDLRQAGPIRLCVVAQLPAGQTLERSVGPGEAVRIMTGAPIPPGANTVVRFEDTRLDGEWVQIDKAPAPGSNVRQAGEDVRQGEIVLRAGQLVRPQEVGMLASVGRSRVAVVRRPRVAILATGDELVDVDAAPEPGKIRNINGYSNAAQVLQAGGQPIMLGIAADRTEQLVAKIREGLDAQADLFITSGGVSVGDFDLVKQVLAAEGRIEFWWVNMKPGKPMAFGTIQGVPLLALPGNPVAAMLSMALFARPAIRKMAGHAHWEWPSITAALSEPIRRKDGRRHYLRVRLHSTAQGLEAELTGDQGSGILKSMVEAQGIAVVPEDCQQLPAGSLVQVLLLD
jgi:molybdopterin molybdotransferase